MGLHKQSVCFTEVTFALDRQNVYLFRTNDLRIIAFFMRSRVFLYNLIDCHYAGQLMHKVVH